MTADAPVAIAGVQRIVLIGFRGSGKTTVGRLLARRLNWQFADTDERIQQSDGRSIREIFAAAGEPGFRAIERAAVADALVETQCVVSVGGGAVLDPETRQRISRAGPCVWLSAPPDVLWQRISADAASLEQRPPLTGEAGIAEVERLLEERTAHYRRLCSREFDAARETPEVLAVRIATWLPEYVAEKTA